jgi:hypothetical protein
MVKLRNDGVEYSVYGVQLPCMLLNEKRYLIALCPFDVVSIGRKKSLKDLKWVSLQARALSDESLYSLPVHSYSIKNEHKYLVPLHIYHRSQKISTYRDTSNLEVSLLHQRNTEYEYPDHGTLVSAIETFQTILQFVH